MSVRSSHALRPRRSTAERGIGSRSASVLLRETIFDHRRWRERLLDGGPFFFFAGAAFILAVLAATGAVRLGTGHVALWALFIGIGLIVGGGGVAATILDDDRETDRALEYDPQVSVLVSRKEWEELNELFGSQSAAARSRELSAPSSPRSAPEVTVPPGAQLGTAAPPTTVSSVDTTVELIQELERLATQARSPTPSGPATRESAQPSRPAATTAPGGAAPPAPRPAGPVPPPPTRRPVDPESWRETERTTEPALPPELMALLTELDPSLAGAGAPPEPPKPVVPADGCAGCGSKLGDVSTRFRCVSCWKPLCSACRDRARRAKRAALCHDCGLPAGIDPRV